MAEFIEHARTQADLSRLGLRTVWSWDSWPAPDSGRDDLSEG